MRQKIGIAMILLLFIAIFIAFGVTCGVEGFITLGGVLGVILYIAVAIWLIHG